ncbi:MAG: molybdopterin synthase sulfur carrier subunit [Anaerolinea sp.]|nr:molybdopterin synthase sulfur carrier subunit [Anaerolinea sp.]
MPVLKMPTPLRSYVNGQAEVTVTGATVSEAMQNLVAQFPDLRPHLYTGQDQLRPFVNLFLGESNVRDLRQGLETPLNENDKLILIPSIAGG